MSGPRDATSHEVGQYLQAVEQKDAARLQDIVCNLYPNVMWGTITQSLSAPDQQWVRNNLVPQTADEEFD